MLARSSSTADQVQGGFDSHSPTSSALFLKHLASAHRTVRSLHVTWGLTKAFRLSLRGILRKKLRPAVSRLSCPLRPGIWAPISMDFQTRQKSCSSPGRSISVGKPPLAAMSKFLSRRGGRGSHARAVGGHRSDLIDPIIAIVAASLSAHCQPLELAPRFCNSLQHKRNLLVDAGISKVYDAA